MTCAEVWRIRSSCGLDSFVGSSMGSGSGLGAALGDADAAEVEAGAGAGESATARVARRRRGGLAVGRARHGAAVKGDEVEV